MTDFINNFANAIENAFGFMPGTGMWFMSALLVIVVTGAFAWMSFFNTHWVAYCNDKTSVNRAEMVVAAFAPVSIPALAVMVVVKLAIDRKAANV